MLECPVALRIDYASAMTKGPEASDPRTKPREVLPVGETSEDAILLRIREAQSLCAPFRRSHKRPAVRRKIRE
jgi:hypothetical protein